MSGPAKRRLASNVPLVVLDAGHVPLVVIPLPGLHRGTDRVIALPGPSPEARLLRTLRQTGLSRVGAADHAVTPKAPWTGSGCREHSYGGFGGGHTPFHLHASCRQPDLHNLHYQLGNLCRPGLSHGLTCGAECPRVTVRDRSSPGLMAR